MAKYRRTYTSNGKVTSTANQVIDFRSDTFPYSNTNVQYLMIQTFDNVLRIKLNDESSFHWTDANSVFFIEDIDIDKITILDAGVEYLYTAMSKE
ncbi:hypothetical protein V7128_01385 [Neobacillus vireti]|uniref:hypothetical protein n=1 Tax=Neobacillus vireti TaxID=220686 RepID=UPI002FFD633E